MGSIGRTSFLRVSKWLFAVAALVVSNMANAQTAERSCNVYGTDQTRGVPEDILAFFAHQKSADGARFQASIDGAAVRRCRNSAGNTISTFLSPVEKYVGVCHFGESDISDLFSA